MTLAEHASDLCDPMDEDDANMLDEIDRLAALGLDPFEVLE